MDSEVFIFQRRFQVLTIFRVGFVMDVDKKLTMSLDDLIKKTRKDRPKKEGDKMKGKFDRKGKLSVKKTLGKQPRKEGKATTRSAVKTTGGPTVRKNRRRVVRRVSSGNDRQSPKKKNNQADDGKKFSRKVVVRKGPNAPADERKKIKITNIPYELTWRDVKGALSDVGKIERCDVERGEAIITFSNHKEASRAIQTYNNGDMNGRKIRVCFA